MNEIVISALFTRSNERVREREDNIWERNERETNYNGDDSYKINYYKKKIE